jgi:hypothetical protein
MSNAEQAVCGHCGATEGVVAGDFADEKLIDAGLLDLLCRKHGDKSYGELYAQARVVKSESKGPAWVCKCGAYTARKGLNE